MKLFGKELEFTKRGTLACDFCGRRKLALANIRWSNPMFIRVICEDCAKEIVSNAKRDGRNAED